MNGYEVVTKFLQVERTKLMRENLNPSAYFIRMDIGTYVELLASVEAKQYCRVEDQEMTVHGHILDVDTTETDAPVMSLLPLTKIMPGKTVRELQEEIWNEEQNSSR